MLHNISNYRTGDLCTVESVLSLIYSQPVLYFFLLPPNMLGLYFSSVVLLKVREMYSTTFNTLWASAFIRE